MYAHKEKSTVCIGVGIIHSFRQPLSPEPYLPRIKGDYCTRKWVAGSQKILTLNFSVLVRLFSGITGLVYIP